MTRFCSHKKGDKEAIEMIFFIFKYLQNSKKCFFCNNNTVTDLISINATYAFFLFTFITKSNHALTFSM